MRKISAIQMSKKTKKKKNFENAAVEEDTSELAHMITRCNFWLFEIYKQAIKKRGKVHKSISLQKSGNNLPLDPLNDSKRKRRFTNKQKSCQRNKYKSTTT